MCDRSSAIAPLSPAQYQTPSMKKTFYLLLPVTLAKCYCSFHELRNLWVKYETQTHHQKKPVFKESGEQEKLVNALAYHLLLLQMLWRSLTALMPIQLLHLKFSPSLNLWLRNKKPFTLLSTVERRPLTPVKVLGAIQMLDNSTKPVNKTGVPLHIFGGM